MSEKCPRCGKFHPPPSPEKREATRLAKSLSEMLMKAAYDACKEVRKVRPEFAFLPVIIMNVAGTDDEMLQATTCEFPGGVDPEIISTLLRMTAEHIEGGRGRFTAYEVNEDDPTKH